MSYKVFISSTYRDIDVARDLARRIEEAGVRVFPPDETAPEDNVAASVTRSLREADEVIVILTDNSVNSPGVLYEMGAASGLKRVTPLVVIQDSSPTLRQNTLDSLNSPYIAELAKRAGGLKPQPMICLMVALPRLRKCF
jgi:hypothetical protein